MAAIDVPVITLEPQSMAGGRNLICMCQFTDWLSSLIDYLLGGQHTSHFSVSLSSEFPFVESLYSGLPLSGSAELPGF